MVHTIKCLESNFSPKSQNTATPLHANLSPTTLLTGRWWCSAARQTRHHSLPAMDSANDRPFMTPVNGTGTTTTLNILMTLCWRFWLYWCGLSCQITVEFLIWCLYVNYDIYLYIYISMTSPQLQDIVQNIGFTNTLQCSVKAGQPPHCVRRNDGTHKPGNGSA